MADILLSKPVANSTQSINSAADSRFVFNFPTDQATLAKEGDHLVITFEDGASLRLENFYDTYSKEEMPSFQVDGVEISGEDFFAAFGPDLMPAAGPGAGTATRSARYNEYGTSDLFGGIRYLEELDWGMGQSRPEFVDEAAYGRRGNEGGIVEVAVARSLESTPEQSQPPLADDSGEDTPADSLTPIIPDESKSDSEPDLESDSEPVVPDDSESDSGPDPVSESDSGSDPDPDPGSDAEVDNPVVIIPDDGSDPDSDSDSTNVDSESEGDPVSDSDNELEPDDPGSDSESSFSDSESDSGSDSVSESDNGSDSDPDPGSDAEVDNPVIIIPDGGSDPDGDSDSTTVDSESEGDPGSDSDNELEPDDPGSNSEPSSSDSEADGSDDDSESSDSYSSDSSDPDPSEPTDDASQEYVDPQGHDLVVDDAALRDTSDPRDPKGTDTAGGTMTIEAKDGIDSITVNGTSIAQNGKLNESAVIENAEGTLTFTSLTANDGGSYALSYSYTLSRASSRHDQADSDTSVSDTFDVLVTDTDGDTGATHITVQIIDDTPIIEAKAVSSKTLLETSEDSISYSVEEFFDMAAGADGEQSTSYTLEVVQAETGVNALFSDGSAAEITLSGGDTKIVGTASGTDIFTLTLNGDQLELKMAGDATIDHSDGSFSLKNFVSLNVQVTDNDGDTASETAALDLAITDAGVELETSDVNTVYYTENTRPNLEEADAVDFRGGFSSSTIYGNQVTVSAGIMVGIEYGKGIDGAIEAITPGQLYTDIPGVKPIWATNFADETHSQNKGLIIEGLKSAYTVQGPDGENITLNKDRYSGEISAETDGSYSEAVIFTINDGKLAHGVNIEFGAFYNNASNDKTGEDALVSFYRGGDLIHSELYTSNTKTGTMTGTTDGIGDYISSGFDQVVITATHNGDNSDFTIQGIDFITLPQPKAAMSGSVTGISPDGFDPAYGNATFDYADGATIPIVVNGTEYSATLSVSHGVNSSMVTAILPDDPLEGPNELFTAVLDPSGNWSFNLVTSFQSMEGGEPSDFALSFVTKDKDGVEAKASVSLDTGLNHTNLSDETQGNELTGTDGADVMTGLDGDDILHGLGDDDLLFGDGSSEAAESLKGFDAENMAAVLEKQSLAPESAESETDDSIPKKLDPEAFETGNDGDDLLYGEAGEDLLFGGGGDDFLTGGADADLLYGGSGNDLLVYDDNDYMVVGGSGIDVMLAEEDMSLDEILAGGEGKPVVQDVEVLITGSDGALVNLTGTESLTSYGVEVTENSLSLNKNDWQQRDQTDDTFDNKEDSLTLQVDTNALKADESEGGAEDKIVFTRKTTESDADRPAQQNDTETNTPSAPTEVDTPIIPVPEAPEDGGEALKLALETTSI